MGKSLSKLLRCEERFEFDRYKRSANGVLCGVDEAGRGPWVGRVYAAAVIFDNDVFIDGIDDSKKLSEKKRGELYDEIILKARDFSIAFAEVEEIERLNILQATFLAMKRAVNGLKVSADLILVDGNQLPDFGARSEAIVKGDSLSASIAAASILAKVSRDNYIKEIDIDYPQYSFIKNKGYGTAEHIAALREYGITPYHRRSFLKKQEAKLGKFKEYGDE